MYLSRNFSSYFINTAKLALTDYHAGLAMMPYIVDLVADATTWRKKFRYRRTTPKVLCSPANNLDANLQANRSAYFKVRLPEPAVLH